jgi:hypothetical protein
MSNNIIQRQQQCCSYCRTPGHRVTHCDSQNITILINTLRNIFNGENIQDLYDNLDSQDPILVTAAAARIYIRVRSTQEQKKFGIVTFIVNEYNRQQNYNNQNQNNEQNEINNMQNEVTEEDAYINMLRQDRALLTFVIQLIDILSQPRRPTIRPVLTQTAPQVSMCPICYEDKEQITTNCGHQFCVPCMYQHLDSVNHVHCPMCRTNITELHVHKEQDANIVQEKYGGAHQIVYENGRLRNIPPRADGNHYNV